MKKITFLAILMVSFLTNAQIFLSEDFEAGIPSDWTNQNNSIDLSALPSSIWTVDNTGTTKGVNWTDPTTNLYSVCDASGTYALFDSDANGGGDEDVSLTTRLMDCSSATEVKLQYDHLFVSGYAGAGFVEVSADGTSWTEFANYGTDIEFGTSVIDISSIAAGQATVYVRFRFTGNYSWVWYVDNIVVQQPQGNAPDVCTNMAPVDQATDVEISVSTTGLKMIMFSWDAATTGDPATSYNWVFGETAETVTQVVSAVDGTVEGMGGITLGNSVESGWQANTTYYWKVQSVNIAGTTDSPIFSFTTAASDPLGVEELTINTLSVSPNPVKDMITINSPVGFDSVEVFNQLGQLVLKSNAELLNNNRLDLSALNPGMYMLQIKAENKSKTVKIIKE